MPDSSPTTRKRHSRLSLVATTWDVAASLAVIYVLSTVPTPLYELYRERLGFTGVTLTVIYAAYVVGSLGAMFFLGRLSDQIGRRPVVLASLMAGVVAVVLFLFADATVWLFAARVVSGFAIALASGASTAWIVESHRAGKKQATRIAIGANLLGLAVGPLLAGVLAQYEPAPLRLVYVVLLLMLISVLIAAWFGAETVREPTPLHQAKVHPRFGVPRELRVQFLVPAISAFSTFAVLGFYAALVPGLLRQGLHQPNLAVAGAVTGGMFLVASVTVALVEVPPIAGVIVGLGLLIPGVGMMVLAEHVRSMAWLVVASVVIGVAAGLGYRFGLEMVNEMAPDDRRSELVSGYLIVCYGAISLPVIGIGVVTAASSAMLADTIFGVLVAVLALAALVIELLLRARRGAQTHARA
jgi:MFS family permease